MKRLFLILVLLIFIAGCQQQGIPNKIGGINIEFQPSYPPNELVEGQEFSIYLKLSNFAQTDIDDGEICIYDDIGKEYGGIEMDCQDFTLSAPSEVKGKLVASSKDITSPQDGTYYYSSFSKDLNGNIKARAIYHVKSIVNSNICIKREMVDKDCKSEETISGSKIIGKVLPLTVTQIEKRLVPGGEGVKLLLTLTLEKSSGEISNYYTEQQGEPAININVIYGSYGEVICRDVKEEKLIWKDLNKNKQTLNCNILLPYSGTESQSNQLDVNLDYYYKIEKSKPIKIKAEESLGIGEEEE